MHELRLEFSRLSIFDVIEIHNYSQSAQQWSSSKARNKYPSSNYNFSAIQSSPPLEAHGRAFEMDFDRRLWRLDKRLWCLPFEIQLQVINLLDVETKL